MQKKQENYQRIDSVVTREIGEETVLVPLSNDQGDLENIFRLNAVGRFIWEQLLDPICPEVLIQKITDHFEVSSETAENDLVEFLSTLQEAELLRVPSTV